MLVTQDRVVYAGLLGAPTLRSLGSLTLYVAADNPFELRMENRAPQRAYLAFVPPNCPHQIQSADRRIFDILFEPEGVNTAEILRTYSPLMTHPGAEYQRIRAAFATWQGDMRSLEGTAASIDRHFLGQVVKPKVLDHRISRAAQLIRARPCEQFFAAEYAQITGLSFSRFVHLFKEQIGMTFRAFCAWKRARAVLPYVTGGCNLTDLALQTGYPDSTHFSHSIRRIYGLTPRDIVAGSRKLTLRIDAANDVVHGDPASGARWETQKRRGGALLGSQTLRALG